MNQSEIVATLRYLKLAAANISSASLAIVRSDKTASANIDRLLLGTLSEITRLELLHFASLEPIQTAEHTITTTPA